MINYQRDTIYKASSPKTVQVIADLYYKSQFSISVFAHNFNMSLHVILLDGNN